MSSIESVRQNLIAQLTAQKKQVIQEICDYPPPIPACDAQFNYLLEKRDLLHAELNRLNALAEHSAYDLLDFMATSPFVGEALQQDLRPQLK